MSNSNFYFVASIRGRGFVHGIPVYAFTEGDTFTRGWTSSWINEKGGIKALAARISGSRMFSIAIPQIYAIKDFPLKQEFSRMNIYAYYTSSNPGKYMFGMSIATVLEDIAVYRNQQLKGWQGLPEPIGGQRKYLEENVQNWSLPVGITLSVKDGQVNVVDNTPEY